jgi:hypothetical protein
MQSSSAPAIPPGSPRHVSLLVSSCLLLLLVLVLAGLGLCAASLPGLSLLGGDAGGGHWRSARRGCDAPAMQAGRVYLQAAQVQFSHTLMTCRAVL